MPEKKKKRRWIKRILWFILTLFLIAGITTATTNLYMFSYASPYVLSPEQTVNFDADCVLVLGARVYDNGQLSPMLKDRVDFGIAVYENKGAKKILLSGDHGRKEYNEVGAMMAYCEEKGIPKEDIFLDHAGFDTYDSMYRAKEIFKAQKVIIVTQKYHLTRAVYIARKLGLEAYGVPSDPQQYAGQVYRDFREILARTKDFFGVLFRVSPACLGDAVPINGSGIVTHDESSSSTPLS